MSIHHEIEALRNALKSSPDNVPLRILLIKKMLPYQDYQEEIESQCQHILKIYPNNTDAKSLLMQHYFAQDKLSATIIIGEEVEDPGDLTLEAQIALAKSYLREGNDQQALELYQEIHRNHPKHQDEELDNAFKIGSKEFDQLEEDLGFVTQPKINFSEVGGLDDVKREIELKIIKPLEHAELYAQYGKKIGGGILLYGPPGCGKTHLARATAGEIDARFINVSLHDILDMWIGNSEKNLNNIFEQARANTPCVLFFDEIDALGAKRSDFRQSSGKNVINQFLAELDGLHADNEGILIIGATNVPWHLDGAFRRPGRFDRIIFVPPPDQEGREIILKIKLKDKPLGGIDYQKLAKQTSNYSGADLEAIVDIAIEQALEDAIETGTPKPLDTQMLLKAIKKHNPSTQEWFMTAKNYATFANQSGTYDPILAYMKKQKMI